MPLSNDALERVKRLYALEGRKGLHGAVEVDPQGFEYHQMLRDYTNISYDEQAKIRDYQAMGKAPELALALDIYADNATQPNFKNGRCIWVQSDHEEVLSVVDELLSELEADWLVWGQARAVAQFGVHTVAPLWRPEQGVVMLRSCAPGTVRRVEDDLGQLLGYMEEGHDQYSTPKAHSKPWHYIQMAIRAPAMISGGDATTTGMENLSVLEPARQTWMEYRLIEDCLLVLRMKSAIDRMVIPLNVTGVAYEEQEDYIKRFRRSLKRRTFQSREELVTRYRSVLMDEDIVVPVTDDKPFSIERFEGKANIAEVADLDHWRRKLSGAVKVPQSYGGFEQEISTRATLAMQDIEFARSVRRLQRAIIAGWTNIINLHLAIRGYGGQQARAADLPEFAVHMTPPSTLEEQARAEYLTTVADLATRMWELGNGMGISPQYWGRYVLRSILGMPEDMVKVMLSHSAPTAMGPGGGEEWGGSGEEMYPAGGQMAMPGEAEMPAQAPGSPGEHLRAYAAGRELVDNMEREHPGLRQTLQEVRQTGMMLAECDRAELPQRSEFVRALRKQGTRTLGSPAVRRK